MHTGSQLRTSVPLRSCHQSSAESLQIYLQHKLCRAGEAALSLGEALLHSWAALQLQTPWQHPALPTPSPTRSRWHCRPSRGAQFKARTNSSAKLHWSISCLHCSQHTSLSRHIFVHILLFERSKSLIGRNCPLQRHEPAKPHASGSCLWLHPGKIITAYDGSSMPPLLGGPEHPHLMLGKGGKGQSQTQQHIYSLAWGTPSFPLRVWPFINQPPAFPEPHQRLCNKNRAVTHSLESCPDQTVLPCLPHPCHMLHGCGAREEAGTQTAIQNPIMQPKQLQFGTRQQGTQPDLSLLHREVSAHPQTHLGQLHRFLVTLVHLQHSSASLYPQSPPKNLPHFPQTPTQLAWRIGLSQNLIRPQTGRANFSRRIHASFFIVSKLCNMLSLCCNLLFIRE